MARTLAVFFVLQQMQINKSYRRYVQDIGNNLINYFEGSNFNGVNRLGHFWRFRMLGKLSEGNKQCPATKLSGSINAEWK